MGQTASQPEGIFVVKQFASPFTLSEKTTHTFTDIPGENHSPSASPGSRSPRSPRGRSDSNVGGSGSGGSSMLGSGSGNYLAVNLNVGSLLLGNINARQVRVEIYSIRHEDLIKSYSFSDYFVMDSANVYVNEKLLVQYCHVYGPISNKSHYMKRYVSTGIEETLNMGGGSKWIGKDFEFIIKHDYKKMASEEKLFTLNEGIPNQSSSIEEVEC